MTTSLAASYEYCRQLTRRTAHNFGWAFLTLPHDRRAAMNALYAFMRIADDCSDDTTLTLDERRTALTAWSTSFTEALAGAMPTHPALPAVIDTVQRYNIPPQYFQDVLTGVARDMEPVTIATFVELENYCYHVAGAVGLCCLSIWGIRDPAAIPHGIECGLAFQLTNILRDIGEDRDLGRVYLPAEDLSRFDLKIEELGTVAAQDRYRALMQFEVQRARDYYDRSEVLYGLIEPVGRPILRVMRDIYRGLLDEIERRDYDVFSQRVSLPKWKKLWAVGKALMLPR
jgi:15-cis-phytoene synthase